MSKQKQNGGNGNNGNKGGIPKGALCAEQGALGRMQKKQAAKARQAAKLAMQEQSNGKVLKEIEDAYASASPHLGHLAAGHFGEYGIKDGDNVVILRVADRAGKPVVYVDHSQVKDIPACDRKFIPVSTLRFPGLQQVTPAEIFVWQEKVHAFLRKHVAPFLVTRVEGLGKKWQEENPGPVPVITEVKVDVTGAVPVSVAMFLGVKDGATCLYVQKDADGNEVYFRTERIAGNQAVSLIVADEGHEMYRVFVSQTENVRVHLPSLSLDTRPYDGSLADVKASRECLRQYLRICAFSLGLKAKQKHLQETPAISLAK